MITLAEAPPSGLNFGSHGRSCYTRIRVIMRRVLRRADLCFYSSIHNISGLCYAFYRYVCVLAGWTVKQESGQIVHGCSDLPSIPSWLTVCLQGLGGLPGETTPRDQLACLNNVHL